MKNKQGRLSARCPSTVEMCPHKGIDLDLSRFLVSSVVPSLS